jgi:RNA polymerase sigma-70 factor (ECF subfamily)
MNDTSAPGQAGTVDEDDESALVAAAQAGDKAAMERLLGRHFAYVDRLCRRMLRDRFDAEDARQEALFQAARRIATFQGRSTFRTWLHTITRRECLNVIRGAGCQPDVPVAEVSEHRNAPTSHPQHRVAERLDVESALNAVNPAYRDALVLWFICDLDYAQIATTLGIPINTVRSRLRRGKAELVELLGELGDSPAASNPRGPGPGADPRP